jgi:hypothetical protein
MAYIAPSFWGHSPFYPVPARRRAILVGALFVAVDFKSAWFKLYHKAVLESNPASARILIREALTTIKERLQSPDLGDEGREAMLAAVRYLTLLDEIELPQAS